MQVSYTLGPVITKQTQAGHWPLETSLQPPQWLCETLGLGLTPDAASMSGGHLARSGVQAKPQLFPLNSGQVEAPDGSRATSISSAHLEPSRAEHPGHMLRGTAGGEAAWPERAPRTDDVATWPHNQEDTCTFSWKGHC
jgi:hypothetical protein